LENATATIVTKIKKYTKVEKYEIGSGLQLKGRNKKSRVPWGLINF